MKLTQPQLTIVFNAMNRSGDVPDWVMRFSRMAFDEIWDLPVLDKASVGELARPSIETKVVTRDYIEFLRGQIAVSTRGHDWQHLLSARLAALARVRQSCAFLARKPLHGNRTIRGF